MKNLIWIVLVVSSLSLMACTGEDEQQNNDTFNSNSFRITVGQASLPKLETNNLVKFNPLSGKFDLSILGVLKGKTEQNACEKHLWFSTSIDPRLVAAGQIIKLGLPVNDDGDSDSELRPVHADFRGVCSQQTLRWSQFSGTMKVISFNKGRFIAKVELIVRPAKDCDATLLSDKTTRFTMTVNADLEKGINWHGLSQQLASRKICQPLKKLTPIIKNTIQRGTE